MPDNKVDFPELLAEPFLQILHTVLRRDADGSDAECARVQKGIEWLLTNAARLRKVSNDDERQIISCIHEYVASHKEGPDRKRLDALVRRRTKHDGMLEILKQYDSAMAFLEPYCHADLGGFLDQRVHDYEVTRVAGLLAVSNHINTGVKPGDSGQPDLQGPRDAISNLRSELQAGNVFVDEEGIQGGLVADQIKAMQETYQKNKRDHQDGRLFIPTALSVLDSQIRGLGRSEFVGILGYTGQRKSGLARTIAYNAAIRGFNVLFIPLETSVQEELEFFAAIHAQNNQGYNGRFTPNNVSKEAIHTGTLTPVEFEFYDKVVLPDYKASAARHLTIAKLPDNPTWDDVQSFIELEHRKTPGGLDVVVVDYLTLLAPQVSRDKVGDMTTIIQRVKKFLLKAPFCLVTPVQGNRKGFEDATDHDGKWEPTGIFLYSEIEKSLDILLYVYASDAMKAEFTWKIGTCKSRRTADVPPTVIGVEPLSGKFLVVDTSTDKKPSPNMTVPDSHEFMHGIIP